jgi:HAD superfamily hydrolase (TIGR01509 family)
MGSPRAVLFDMDGTLLEPLEDGLPEFKRRWGIARDALVVHTLPTFDSQRRAEADREFAELEARGANESVLRPGMRQLVDELRRRGVRLAMVTNNRRSSASTVLAKHRLVFDAVLTREDVAPKPDPEMIVRALHALGVEAAHATLVGDAPVDALAARAAGLRRIYLFDSPELARFADIPRAGSLACGSPNGDPAWRLDGKGGNEVVLVGSVDDLARRLSSDGVPGLALS